MGPDDEADAVSDAPADDDVVVGRSDIGTGKSLWRRLLEVAAPVAVFAVAAPFAVNGLTTAIDKPAPTSGPAALAPAPTLATAPPTFAPSPASTELTPVSIAKSSIARISIDGVADDADDRTISLATEIVPGTTPASSAIESAGIDPTGIDPSTADATSTTVAPGSQGHSHGVVTPEVALTRSERKALATQLSTARDTAMQFATVADAEAAGYTMVTGYLPLIGAHYIKWDLMDGTFDPAAPEMLLYDGTEPDSNIVGLSYYMFSDTEPSPFEGANDHWHQHIGLCIKDGVVVGGEDTTPAQCAARGGAKAGATNGWMVHAWVVPGWDSPQGVFSPEHPGLTPDLPTS